MAWTPTTVDDIEYVAKALSMAGTKLMQVAAEMRSANFLTMHLQFAEALKFADSFVKLSNDAELHLTNQIHASRTGSEPIWQVRQRKSAYNKALREASVANKKYTRKPESDPAAPVAAKKATKKQSTKRQPPR